MFDMDTVMSVAAWYDTKLNEFAKEEWRDVAKILKPEWTEEEFEAAWQEFLELKRRKLAQ